MRLAYALIIIIIALIICSGCIDKYEREFGIKNPKNFPNEFGNTAGSPGTVKTDPGDRQKAYEEMLKTMDSEPGDIATPVPAPVTPAPTVSQSSDTLKTTAMSLPPDFSTNMSKNQTGSNLTGAVATPTPAINYSRIPKYPDILNLGDVYTFGKTGYERDVTIFKYSMKSNFEIKYAARYGTAYKTIEATNGSMFLFIYPRVAYNGTVSNISMPEPGDFTVLVNNVSYQHFTVPSSYLEDNVSWDKSYTIQGNIIYDEYTGGTLYKGDQKDGLLIYEVPKAAYSGSVLARCEMGYLSYWFKSPVWRLRPEPTS